MGILSSSCESWCTRGAAAVRQRWQAPAALLNASLRHYNYTRADRLMVDLIDDATKSRARRTWKSVHELSRHPAILHSCIQYFRASISAPPLPTAQHPPVIRSLFAAPRVCRIPHTSHPPTPLLALCTQESRAAMLPSPIPIMSKPSRTTSSARLMKSNVTRVAITPHATQSLQLHFHH